MDSYQYPTISSFRDIELGNKRPFVLCDIDETVLHHKHTFQQIYNMIETDYSNDPDTTPDFILSVATQYYLMYQKNSIPTHTDLEGFNDFIKRIEELGGELCFLTARGSAFDIHTRQQLRTIGIEDTKYKIHYCAGVVATKGEYIEKFIDIHEKEDVIFIDDYDHFILSVLIKHPQIRCYKFSAIKDMDYTSSIML